MQASSLLLVASPSRVGTGSNAALKPPHHSPQGTSESIAARNSGKSRLKSTIVPQIHMAHSFEDFNRCALWEEASYIRPPGGGRGL